MPGRYNKLRREMKADFELTWAGQADSNKRLSRMATKLDDHATKIEEQGQQIAKQGKQIAESMRETARLGREVVANGDQMVGRFRQMDDRFGKFIDVLESEADEQSEAIADLQARVARLEQRQGPAA